MSDRLHGAQMTCPVVLDRTSKAWEALRPGPVYDIDTGAHLIDIDADVIAEAERTTALMVELGIPIPIDYGHAIQRASGGEPAKTYGRVLGASRSDDGKLLIDVDLTDGGRELLSGSEGAYWVSPAFGSGPLHHPETGERLADRYIESHTITPIPRQNALNGIALSKGPTPPAMLARFASDDETYAFRRGLEEAAAKAINDAYGHAPQYLSLRGWQSEDRDAESGTFGASYYYGEPERHWLFQLDWSRDVSGAVTASNPVPAVERTIIEPMTTQEQAARAVSLSKEDCMSMQTMDVTALVAPLDAGVELSKADPVSVEVPPEAAKVLEGAIVLAKQHREALDKARKDLADAEKRATAAESAAAVAGEAGVQLSKLRERLDGLEAYKAQVEAEKAEAAKLALAREQVRPLIEDGSIPEGAEERMVSTAIALGKDAFAEHIKGSRAAGLFKPGTFSPMAPGRPVGASGAPDDAGRAAAFEARIVELSKEKKISRGQAAALLLAGGA